MCLPACAAATRRRSTCAPSNVCVNTCPAAPITTDVLTGFPGETDEEAQETLDFVRAVGFARIHVFPYSRRKGTAADAMPNQVPESVKHERAAKLLALGNQLEENYVSTLVGTVQDCC